MPQLLYYTSVLSLGMNHARGEGVPCVPRASYIPVLRNPRSLPSLKKSIGRALAPRTRARASIAPSLSLSLPLSVSRLRYIMPIFHRSRLLQLLLLLLIYVRPSSRGRAGSVATSPPFWSSRPPRGAPVVPAALSAAAASALASSSSF